MTMEDYDDYEEYDPDVYEDSGEGFEDDSDAVGEKIYEKAFAQRQVEENN